MTYDSSTMSIQAGMKVVGSDGGKIGGVEEDVETSYIHVTKGVIFPSDLYIPLSAVQSVDGDQVVLNVSSDQAGDMGWSDLPTDDGDFDGGVATTDYVSTDTIATTQTTDQTDNDQMRVQRMEEELQAQNTAREAGDVTIRKEVVSEEQTLDVPVTREEVEISRRVVDRPATDTADAFQEETIRVPLMEEQVDVTKSARVVEEIDVDKVARQDTQRVSDTVRREEIFVDEQNVTSSDGDTTPNR